MQNRSFQTDVLIPLLDLRVAAYDLLRRTFWAEPSPDYLALVARPGFIESFPFGGEHDEIRQGMEWVATYFQQKLIAGHAPHDELHWDYTRLFIGPYQLPAPPWESAYQSGDRLLLQESVLQVRSYYSRYQFTARDAWQKTDDHLGLELDFMYQLSLLCRDRLHERKAFFAVLGDSLSFLEDHLLSWTPSLCRDIIQNSSTGLYRGMACILNGFLTVDQSAMQELFAIDIK